MESNFTPEVVLWPFLRMRSRNWQEIKKKTLATLFPYNFWKTVWRVYGKMC